MKPGTLLILILLVSLLMVGCIDRSGVGPGWVRTWGGQREDNCSKVAIDRDGNIYTLSLFKGTIEFDSGEEVECLTTTGYPCDLLTKHDSLGNLVWTQSLDYGFFHRDLVVEPTGDIFFTGVFEETVDFDPGPGVTERTSETGMDNYLVRFDPDGNFLQVTTPNAGAFLEMDPMGNLVLFGKNGVERLDLGGSVLWSRELNSNCVELVCDASGNIFYTGTSNKQGPDQQTWAIFYDTAFLGCIGPDGSLLWEQTWGLADPGSFVEDLYPYQIPPTTGSDIALDSEGNIYVIGSYFGEVDFDPGPSEYLRTSSVSAEYHGDPYISKFDSSGNLLSVVTLHSSRKVKFLSLEINSTDQFLVAGNFTGTIDFDPGPGIVERTAVNTEPFPGDDLAYDCFLCSYNTEFEPQWVRTWGGDKENIIGDVTFGLNGCIYIVGSFSSTVDFNPGPEEDLRTSFMNEFVSWPSMDAYLLKLMPDGSW